MTADQRALLRANGWLAAYLPRGARPATIMPQARLGFGGPYLNDQFEPCYRYGWYRSDGAGAVAYRKPGGRKWANAGWVTELFTEAADA